MKTYLVGYDLKKPIQDYESLVKKLKSYKSWWHNLDSTWFIRTDLTSIQLRQELLSYMDSNDKLLIMNVTGAEKVHSGFSIEAQQWLD